MTLRKHAIRCDARERLGEELQQCHLEAMQLGEKEVQAIMDGDRQALAETEHQLQRARLKRDAAIAAFSQHITEHDCF
jgi:hypothetical protein